MRLSDLGDDVVTTFAFVLNTNAKCRTSSGDYYLYVYAQRRTSVSFLVTAANRRAATTTKKRKKYPPTLLAILLPIAFCIAIIVCVAYCGWATWENCKPSNHRPTERPSEEPVFDTPATGQLDQPSAPVMDIGPPRRRWCVASAPPVEQSWGWTWSKATPAQQANRFNGPASIIKLVAAKPREGWTFGDGEKWAFGGGGGGVSANAASSAPAVVATSSGLVVTRVRRGTP